MQCCLRARPGGLLSLPALATLLSEHARQPGLRRPADVFGSPLLGIQPAPAFGSTPAAYQPTYRWVTPFQCLAFQIHPRPPSEQRETMRPPSLTSFSACRGNVQARPRRSFPRRPPLRQVGPPRSPASLLTLVRWSYAGAKKLGRHLALTIPGGAWVALFASALPGDASATSEQKRFAASLGTTPGRRRLAGRARQKQSGGLTVSVVDPAHRLPRPSEGRHAGRAVLPPFKFRQVRWPGCYM